MIGPSRWNTGAFPALYCCLAKNVATSVRLDLYDVDVDEARNIDPLNMPVLIEFRWSGSLFDLTTETGLQSVDLLADYPEGHSDRGGSDTTRTIATDLYDNGNHGLVCRSASCFRLGNHNNWDGSSHDWSEVAIWPRQSGCNEPQYLGFSEPWALDAAIGANSV